MLDLRARTDTSTRRAFLAWTALIVIAFAWGRVLVLTHHRMVVQTPPFFGAFRFHPSLRLLPAIALAALVIIYGRRAAQVLSWRALLTATAIVSALWCVSLSYIDNAHALTDPLTYGRNDYLQTAHTIGSLHSFLHHFVDGIARYGQDTMGHPPGMPVLEWALSKFGLATPGWNTMLAVGGGVAAGIAVLVALRDVVDESAARRAAPFIALVPAAIWWSSFDAFFAGVSAWTVTVLLLASNPNASRRRTDVFAFAGGLGFGICAFLSYGLALLAIIPVTIAVARRRSRPLVVATVGALLIFGAFALAGFSWFAGLEATRHQYWLPTGAAAHRPYSYFLIGDLSLFAVATGPAVAAALAQLRDRRVWLLVGAALAVVAIADLSGMSKAEVERIWLPFVPWVVAATAGLTHQRRFLGMQAACAMLVGVSIWSIW